MQKLNMIQAFVELPEGIEARFAHPEGQADQSRLIKMRINAPQDCNLYITSEGMVDEDGVIHDGEERFLAHIIAGFEQLEFYYRGGFSLAVLGGPIWLDTVDNTAFSVEASDFTSYARLWEREERDPRILEIERAARHNQEQLRQQMAADMAAHLAAMEERMKANVAPAQGNDGSGAQGGAGGTVVPPGAHSVDPKVDPPAQGGGSGASDDEA